MASNYTSAIQTREDADKYLGGKKERPLPKCDNLRIRRITTMLNGDRPEYTGDLMTFRPRNLHQILFVTVEG